MNSLSYNFPRLEILISLIRYLHNNPGAKIEDICNILRISFATFYRLKKAVSTLGAEICFIKNGYRIINYGIINKRKL
ncbi:MAG: hypothetical protein PHF86_14670 [Candidatus Nanoarchaeia archaeon]|jgi:hypothetical protein|nr:hypothetical protein [Candidatus Nanoarchaeia archaeon]